MPGAPVTAIEYKQTEGRAECAEAVHRSQSVQSAVLDEARIERFRQIEVVPREFYSRPLKKNSEDGSFLVPFDDIWLAVLCGSAAW